MPSPFPGMNPYLERAAAWDSFHPNFISTAHFHVAAQMPPESSVRVETRANTADIGRIGPVAVRDRPGNELVAVIELLSPTNEYAGPDREQYIGKRNELLRSRTHFVELDPRRGGPRMPPDDLPTGDCCAAVSRVEGRPRAGVWSWRLRDPMPLVPIPPRSPDADARLDLKAVVDGVYDGGRYASHAYGGPPEPRLAPDDAAWAASLLPAPAGPPNA